MQGGEYRSLSAVWDYQIQPLWSLVKPVIVDVQQQRQVVDTQDRQTDTIHIHEIILINVADPVHLFENGSINNFLCHFLTKPKHLMTL